MSQKRIKTVQIHRKHGMSYGLGIAEDEAAAIIAARAKAVVDRVVSEAMENVRARPRSLREARLVKKGEVRLNGR